MVQSTMGSSGTRCGPSVGTAQGHGGDVAGFSVGPVGGEASWPWWLRLMEYVGQREQTARVVGHRADAGDIIGFNPAS